MKTLIKVFFSIICIQVFGNAAQPGIYNGGGAAFTLLYPEDSASFKQVQMQREVVLVQLYKGFAAVKGHYVMHNTSSQSVALRMGYPINGVYESESYPDLQEVFFDSLSAFMILENGKQLELFNHNNNESYSDNWMIWETQFLPNETKDFDIYFIVNTNDARVREGYNSEQKNVFMYLFESGSTWKQPIENATLCIQLVDGLQLKDIKGVSNPFELKAELSKHYLLGIKQIFEPKAGDNLIIAYGENLKNFDFAQIIANKETIYSNLNAFQLTDEKDAKLDVISFASPFEVTSTMHSFLPKLIVNLLLYAPIILFVLFLLILVSIVLKWKRNKKRIDI